MENFIIWLFNSFYSLIATLTDETVNFIDSIISGMSISGNGLEGSIINLVLFSDTPILTLDAYELALWFFSIFYTVIFIVIFWKIIKKVFVKITRWNKW